MSRKWSGEVARDARLAAGYARPEDAAERLGVHLATVYAWEQGRPPQMRFAAAIADLYGVPLDSFFVIHDDGDNGNDPRDPSPENTSPVPTAARRSGDGAASGG